MHRDADGPPLVGNGTGDGLPDPPCRVSGELEAPVRLKLLRRLHQAEVALLDEVEKGQPPARVALGHRDHQPQIRLAEASAGVRIPCSGSTGQRLFLFCREERHLPDLLQIGFHRVVQRHALGRKLMFQSADLGIVQQREVGVLFLHPDAVGLQRLIQRVQPGDIVLLLFHGAADLLRRQKVVPGTARQNLCKFFRLRQFPHDSFSFQLQPGGKGALSLLQGEFPVSFLASTGDTALSLHWTSGPPSSRSGCRGRCVPDKS